MGVLRVCRVATIPIPIRPRYKSRAKKLLSATSASPPPPPGCRACPPRPLLPTAPPTTPPFATGREFGGERPEGSVSSASPSGPREEAGPNPRAAGGAAGTREGPAGDERRGTSRAERFYDPAWRGGVPVPEGPRPRRRPSTGIAGQGDRSLHRHPPLSPPAATSVTAIRPGPVRAPVPAGSRPATVRGEGWEAEGPGGMPAGACQRPGTARGRPPAGRPPSVAPTVHGNRPDNRTHPRAAAPLSPPATIPMTGNRPGPVRPPAGRIRGRRPPRPGERGRRPKGLGARGQGPRPEPARPGVLPGRAREGPIRGGFGARWREAARPDAARGGPRRATPASAVVLEAAPPTESGERGRRRRGRLP